ncbi:MAG: DEAD/DEAH box helicase family protein [Lachnospiraceae bacterium]|nr:DEAD/DEAH box helicase family protein [Lachnospiraceae bacterium]
MEIAAGYMAGKPLDEIVDLLKSKYRGGTGLLTNNGRLSAWFGEDGIRISKGDRARYTGQFQLVSWENAAGRIGELLDTGRFASNVELEEAPGHFRTMLAQSIWYLRHDLSEDASKMDFFPSIDRYRSGGFPEETAKLAEALADAETLRAVTSELERFSDAYAQVRGLLRFHYHNIPEILDGLHSLFHPWREYASDLPEVPEAGHFITEDEIDEALSRGSQMSGGKMRIFEYFSDSHTTKEQADFLREEYGTGGHSGAFSNNSGSFEDHDGKGIRLTKPGCANVSLTWNAVAKRIAALIKEDRYLTSVEKAQVNEAQVASEPEEDPFDDIDPVQLRKELERRGIVNGQLVDGAPESPFVRMVMEDVERIAAEEAAEHGMPQQAVSDAGENAQSASPSRETGVDVPYSTDAPGADWEQVQMDPANRFSVVEVGWYPSHTAYSIWDEQTRDYYKDADGQTIDFLSQRRAEDYRQDLIERIRADLARTPLDKAKDLIDEYCMEEFSSPADFDDLRNIGIGYTTVTNNEYPVEASVNLIDFRLERRLNGKEFDTRQYDSLEELISHELYNLDFNDLMDVSDDELDAVLDEPETDVPTDLDIGMSNDSQPSESAPVQSSSNSEKEPEFPYQTGDTVYLEDGKAFIIDSIGMFDVHLRDPEQVYPILRAESRENFLRLVERYPQPQIPHLQQPESSDLAEPADESDAQKVTEETVASYHGEETGLPYNVEIRRMHFDTPEQGEPSRDVDSPELGIPSFTPAEPENHPADTAPPTVGNVPPVSAVDLISEPGRSSDSISVADSGAMYADNLGAEPAVSAVNFRITNDHHGEGGPKQKYAMNIAAIRTLLTVESENRNATPEEQAVLSRYVGWGSLPDAFDPNKPAWSEEYRELKSLLSDEEYAAARASTLNAHYTSPVVIRAIYDAVGQMGFSSGNILEPSMGVGNFFGLLPDRMRESRLYGVELDPVSGRIAKKLYPNADITIGGFESTDRRDFYDLAVGNVPFGDYRVSDRPYDKLGFSIHNYFFAKALDQVRPGGIVAFVTSRYTMDAQSPDVRKYLAQRAELLGAIRLPDNAFKANAGTEVVSDIIFLQKRETPIEIEPDWVHLGLTPGGYPINSYFADHPEMVLGELTEVSTQYGRKECTVTPIPGADLAGQLKATVSHIHGRYESAVIAFEDSQTSERETLPADPAVKNYSYAAVDGDVYFREDSVMRKVKLGSLAKERALGMISLRETVNELIEYQMEDYPDAEIAGKQRELEAAYDAFTEKHGLINSRPNARVFADDSSYYLLCSLEDVDEEGNLIGKADMFTKRTIRPDRSVTHVDTPAEALAVSIGERGKPDLPFMAELLGEPEDYTRITEELSGVIFRDPLEASDTDITKGWHTADDYLSGNVREKLRVAKIAAGSDPAYVVNVVALEKAQPKDLDASEIDVRLGATWIDVDYIQQFMEETFETPFYLRNTIEVKFSSFTAEWQVTGKTRVNSHDVAAYVTYGTDRANAYRILEESLNLKDIRIYDTVEDADGKQKRILNKKETTLAQQKQQAIKDAFRDWVWKDPYRREELCRKYNELFNSTRPREYDGSHIHFVGMNPEIMLREHQKNAIAHILYGGNTLLAHEVGAGKTFEMAAAAMESKRLGLCQKSLFVVPNHLTIQWANEFLRLYPSAKLLVATRKDFEASRRKKFCARIATGDYDAVIIGHSQFERIPVSTERQKIQLEDQIEEIEDAIASMKYQRGENFTIKQMEKTRRSLQARLDKLMSTERKDDVVTFEQLGVDRLFIDESQAFKNLFLYTKMRNVAGLSTSESQRSSDMFMKCRYLDEITGGRGVVFATGTPVSNSMTELYTVMHYLQYGSLQKMGLTHFDCWASTFGETTTAIELAPEGTGYRARTRFAKFFNLPELMNLFKEVADIKTSDQLNLPVPEAEYETVVVQPSEFQEEMVQDLSERAALVHAGTVDPSEDNMLKITSDGRKIGLDQRLMNDLLPDDPGSKLNACVSNVFRIWEEGTPEKLTQLLFCDMSTPKKDGTFNVYDDIRDKLIARGVPEEEVAFIHSADTEVKKKDLFAKVRSGQVRVLMGSTQKMGAGTNVQDRLIAVHHLDVGWRPADMTQRNGRIIRQENQNKKVYVYQYVTEGTFDAYLYQTLENKQKFISQIMTSKSPVRSCDDVDEQALSYAEIKALCEGSPLIKEKMDLDIDVARLKVLKADHQSKQYRLEDQLLKYFPAEIERQQGYIRGFTKDMETVAAHPHPEDGFAGMEVAGRTYHEKAEAGAAILAICKTAKSVEGYPLGTYRGFSMQLSFDSFEKKFCIFLKGEMTHRVPIGNDARGNLTRLDNTLGNIPAKLEQAETKLTSLEQQQEAAMQEVGKPFPQEAELAEKSARLAELDAELNMDDGSVAVRRGRDSGDDRKQDVDRPSVLNDLKEKAGQVVSLPHEMRPRKEAVL